MKHIPKDPNNEPPSLKAYRSTPSADFDSCNKEDIRLALLEEQGAICAYCMNRISNDRDEAGKPKMTIEHFEAQSKNADLRLNYTNMLGVCLGNRGKAKHLQHCDVSRGNKPLYVDPRQKHCEEVVKYRPNGEIYAESEQITSSLEDTLNLNVRELRDGRKIAMDMAKKSLNRYTIGEINREITVWGRLEQSGKYRPFCRAAIYILQKKLNRL